MALAAATAAGVTVTAAEAAPPEAEVVAGREGEAAQIQRSHAPEGEPQAAAAAAAAADVEGGQAAIGIGGGNGSVGSDGGEDGVTAGSREVAQGGDGAEEETRARGAALAAAVAEAQAAALRVRVGELEGQLEAGRQQLGQERAAQAEEKEQVEVRPGLCSLKVEECCREVAVRKRAARWPRVAQGSVRHGTAVMSTAMRPMPSASPQAALLVAAWAMRAAKPVAA